MPAAAPLLVLAISDMADCRCVDQYWYSRFSNDLSGFGRRGNVGVGRLRWEGFQHVSQGSDNDMQHALTNLLLGNASQLLGQEQQLAGTQLRTSADTERNCLVDTAEGRLQQQRQTQLECLVSWM